VGDEQHSCDGQTKTIHSLEGDSMKTRIALLTFALISSIGIAILSYAAGSKIVEGDLLKIEGEFYTVHDMADHEVRLHVDKITHLEGAFKAGDKVEAYVTDTGHARSMYHIKHLQLLK
jgi:hypothetical protein